MTGRRQSGRRRARGTLAPHATAPPSASPALRGLARAARPPGQGIALAWVRTQAHAGTLAGLARAYLRARDAGTIERLLRASRHGQAARRFCERFSARCFPLEYPWSDGAGGQLLVELATGIAHEGYGDSWEEYADLWALKPVFLLSWALIEDPYGALRDEFLQDESLDEEQVTADRLCDEARAAIAHLANVPAEELFAGVPPDGFPAGQFRPRLQGTCWEPLVWAAPWLWRLSGNAFLDRSPDDFADPEPWTRSTVLSLMAEYREALRIMRAIDAFDTWLCQAPAEHVRAAVGAALGPASERLSTLLDLPVVKSSLTFCTFAHSVSRTSEAVGWP